MTTMALFWLGGLNGVLVEERNMFSSIAFLDGFALYISAILML